MFQFFRLVIKLCSSQFRNMLELLFFTFLHAKITCPHDLFYIFHGIPALTFEKDQIPDEFHTFNLPCPMETIIWKISKKCNKRNITIEISTANLLKLDDDKNSLVFQCKCAQKLPNYKLYSKIFFKLY